MKEQVEHLCGTMEEVEPFKYVGVQLDWLVKGNGQLEKIVEKTGKLGRQF